MTNRAAVLGSLPLLGLALVAFAANSLLCRQGLAAGAADPWSFTAVRLAAGAFTLVLLQYLRGGLRRCRFDVRASAALYGYATLFSLAYVALDAATGALVLFIAVQMTMLGLALWRGERPTPLAWAGFASAAGGLAWLLSPALDAPAPLATLQMMGAGIAWGLYSVRGARARDALCATTWNFVAACPFALLALAITAEPWRLPGDALLAAALSGAAASGLGYAVWYRVLPRLPAMLAASAQLSVPLLAALGSAWLLNEQPDTRFAASAALILGGIALVIGARPAAARA